MAAHRTTRRTGFALLILALALTPFAAHAGELSDAKAKGQIGERFDGYLEVIGSDAPRKVREFVDSVNARRREENAKLARKNGVTVERVAAVAGKKLVARAEPGHFVMPKDSADWKRKSAAPR